MTEWPEPGRGWICKRICSGIVQRNMEGIPYPAKKKKQWLGRPEWCDRFAFFLAMCTKNGCFWCRPSWISGTVSSHLGIWRMPKHHWMWPTTRCGFGRWNMWKSSGHGLVQRQDCTPLQIATNRELLESAKVLLEAGFLEGVRLRLVNKHGYSKKKHV